MNENINERFLSFLYNEEYFRLVYRFGDTQIKALVLYYRHIMKIQKLEANVASLNLYTAMPILKNYKKFNFNSMIDGVIGARCIEIIQKVLCEDPIIVAIGDPEIRETILRSMKD